MKMNMNDIDELIIDYLTFNLTDEGAEVLRDWLARSEVNRIYFRKTEGLWYGVHTFGNEPFNKQIAYKRYLSRIKEDEKEEVAMGNKKKNFPLSTKKWIWIASIAALFLGVFYGVKFWEWGTGKNDYFAVSVPLGAKSQIVLPDKTTVWLNAGTSLEYNYDNKEKKRRVKIRGEGYFEVAKDKEVPFVVETGCIDIQVLGTKFNVTSYDNDNLINIALLEGAISLHREDEQSSPITVSPNEMAIYDKSRKDLLISHIDASQTILWTRGILEFENESFERIVQMISRKYNVNIQIADKKLNEKRFYGTFDEKESVYDVLDKITLGDKITYEVKNKTIVIYLK